MKRFVISAIAIAIFGIVLINSVSLSTTAQTPGDIPMPNHSDDPTPFPTPVHTLPPIPPVPTTSVTLTKNIPIYETPTMMSDSDSYNISISLFRNPSIEDSTKDANAILIGTVTQVEAPRWSTADGSRPPHPHSQPGYYEIYRVVHLQIEEQITGTITTPNVLIYAFGGIVGEDSMVLGGDDLYEFAQGQRVIVFLAQEEYVGSALLRRPIDKYTLIDTQATNSFRTIPLTEIRQRIAAKLAEK